MRDYGLTRILVVDLDVHQGNGTSSIFEDDKRVTTFDMHGMCQLIVQHAVLLLRRSRYGRRW